MPPLFTKNDLLMPQVQIDEITDALQNALITDPISVVTVEQKQKVEIGINSSAERSRRYSPG